MSILGKIKCALTKRHVWTRAVETANGHWLKRCRRCGLGQSVKKRKAAA